MASSDKRSEQLERYRQIMLEIKERTFSVGDVANGFAIQNRILAKEFCFLQLRMICECIALSCLVAHGDLSGVSSSKLQKTYEADALMKRLSELHPDFYPIPVRFEFPAEGQIHLADPDLDFLTKSDLIKLVRFCGSKVHRGSVEKYTFCPTPTQLDDDFKKILAWANQILRLLEQHRINLASGRQYLLCYFADQRGLLGVAFAEAPPL